MKIVVRCAAQGFPGFYIFVLRHIDRVPKAAGTSLRRTLEWQSAACRDIRKNLLQEVTMPQATARHILVSTEDQCNQLKAAIEGGADFGAVAREHSSCPSKHDGGNLGSFGRGQRVPEFDAVVFSAPVGVVQGPVKTQFGYHLVEVTSRQD